MNSEPSVLFDDSSGASTYRKVVILSKGDNIYMLSSTGTPLGNLHEEFMRMIQTFKFISTKAALSSGETTSVKSVASLTEIVFKSPTNEATLTVETGTRYSQQLTKDISTLDEWVNYYREKGNVAYAFLNVMNISDLEGWVTTPDLNKDLKKELFAKIDEKKFLRVALQWEKGLGEKYAPLFEEIVTSFTLI